ncbi:hypothetical protein TIFTF001_032773 [Ficus carica]|uniref:Uncharacterized protein n=1 Tax=Ficus carica TaxID=3494 RepID=A0AA88J744_FICCA|nr:hypothetical protein TIFTF001_032773 [Ficus carica]
MVKAHVYVVGPTWEVGTLQVISMEADHDGRGQEARSEPNLDSVKVEETTASSSKIPKQTRSEKIVTPMEADRDGRGQEVRSEPNIDSVKAEKTTTSSGKISKQTRSEGIVIPMEADHDERGHEVRSEPVLRNLDSAKSEKKTVIPSFSILLFPFKGI